MKFSELDLEPSLQSAIEKIGYDDCTPIQMQTIPVILEGKDISGLAQTGTGKTAAFLIPLMERILRARSPEGGARAFPEWRSQNFILILVPTRELAEQVYENILKLSEFSGLRGASVYGGTGYDKQKEAFKAGVEFVVATPGRLIDLYKEHVVDLKQVRAIVFDEADRMFDMGFKDDMKYILQRVPRERQFLVFSATLNFDVLNTAYQFGAEPIEINISRDQAKAENVKDEIFHVGQDEKPKYLLSILKKHNPKQVIVFSNFKMNVERIATFLSSNGFPAIAISSLLSQAQRNRVIDQFKSDNEKNILVATDVAARGLDIKGVDLVVNYELPQDAESYVHRIGRTGRAGAEGHAFSLVSDLDIESLGRIEDYLKHKVDTAWMEESDLITEMKPFPRERDMFRGGGGPRPERPPREERGPRRDSNRRPRPGGGGRSGERERGERRPQQQAASGNGQHHPHQGQKRHDGRRQDQKQGQQHPGGGRRHEQRPPRSGQQTQHPRRQTQGSTHKKVHPKVTQKSVGQKVTGFFKKLFGG